MNMLQLRLSAERLIRFAQGQGLNSLRDEDLGYACHALLGALFGELAPQPFRLFGVRGRRAAELKLLAYSPEAARTLGEYAELYAEPEVYQTLLPDGLVDKPIPAVWSAGRRLGFEVLTCPISRKAGHEKDVFLRRLDQGGDTTDLDRATVYRDWLAGQMRPAARLLDMGLDSFRIIRMLRRAQSKSESERRPTQSLRRPQATLSGTLEIADGAAFSALLARGVGRHRAFGYGMLLLRPVR